jgi:hypothetical protein
MNEGIAIDARLVKSARRPISNTEVRKRKEKSDSPEGNVHKHGNALKFSRDLESDWTIKNDTPHYGLKEHTSVDVESGFVLATTLPPASEHDSTYLPYLTIASCHTNDPIITVHGDNGLLWTPQSSLSPYERNQRRNHAQRYHHCQTDRVRDTKEQEDIQEAIHSLPARRASRPEG